jgi:hypothetical protein
MTPKILRYSAKRHAADDATIDALWKAGFQNGYAVAVHGSRGPKDLDIIAVPWANVCCGVDELIEAFCHCGKLLVRMRPGQKPDKPHGRRAFILIRMDDLRIIDVSVMPPNAKADLAGGSES